MRMAFISYHSLFTRISPSNLRTLPILRGVIKMDQLIIGQQLWFVDKISGEEVSVTVESVNTDYFTFFYKGKEMKCPIKKLGEKIYQVVFYKGEMFRYRNKNWETSNGEIYSESFQEKIEKCYNIRKKYTYDSGELIRLGRIAKNDKKFNMAINYFETAIIKSSKNEISNFVSELSSLYRIAKTPNSSISLYKYICREYVKFNFTKSFLTSVASAYADIGLKEKALRLSDSLYGKLGGKKDDELNNLYKRLNSL